MKLFVRKSIFLLCCVITIGTLHAATGSDIDTGQVLELINELRQQNKLSVLEIDVEAQLSAQSHAEELALRLNLSHRNEEGLRVTERYRLVGGTGLRAGENLGAGDSADLIVNAWMNSPGHRSNILDPSWSRIGVGLHILDSGRLIVVAVFTDSHWKTLNLSRDSEYLTLSGELLISRGSFPEAVFLRTNGDDFSPVSVNQESRYQLNLVFEVPVPYQWRMDRSASFQIVTVENGVGIRRDLLLIPPR